MKAPVSHLKDPDLQKVPQTLLRASEKTRQLAKQTGTKFVVRKAVKPMAVADKKKHASVLFSVSAISPPFQGGGVKSKPPHLKMVHRHKKK